MMDKYMFQIDNSYIAKQLILLHSGELLLLFFLKLISTTSLPIRTVSKPERYSGDNIIYKPPGVSCFFVVYIILNIN